MGSILFDNFSGGLNLRDSPNQIVPSESPSEYNMILDERGGMARRNGCTNVVALPGVSGKLADIFYSVAINQWLCARETAGAPNTFKLFSRPGDLSGAWTDRGTINASVSARAGFVDFPGSTPKVVISTNVKAGGGAVEGIFTWDGTTLTDVAAGNTVAGDAIALWQNKVWVAGYPNSDGDGNPTTLRWCDAGDPTTWTTTNVQQIRDKDAAPLTALGVVSGALVAFKKRSAYRITDSSTGAFSTIDNQVGCVNARAITSSFGRLYVWAPTGLFESDGVGKLNNVGDRLRPLYTASTTDTASICAGVYNDHPVFSGVMSGSSTVIEYSPTQGWAVRHSLASSSQNQLTSFSAKENVLYGAVADGDDLFSMFTATSGSDDGTLYFCNWYMPWILPNSGQLARLQRLRVQGLIGVGTAATLLVSVFKDWQSTGAITYDVSASLLASASTDVQRAVDIQSLGHSSAFFIGFDTATGDGAVSIRALQLVTTELQWPNPGYPNVQRPTRGTGGGGRHSGGPLPPVGVGGGPPTH